LRKGKGGGSDKKVPFSLCEEKKRNERVYLNLRAEEGKTGICEEGRGYVSFLASTQHREKGGKGN